MRLDKLGIPSVNIREMRVHTLGVYGSTFAPEGMSDGDDGAYDDEAVGAILSNTSWGAVGAAVRTGAIAVEHVRLGSGHRFELVEYVVGWRRRGGLGARDRVKYIRHKLPSGGSTATTVTLLTGDGGYGPQAVVNRRPERNRHIRQFYFVTATVILVGNTQTGAMWYRPYSRIDRL